MKKSACVGSPEVTAIVAEAASSNAARFGNPVNASVYAAFLSSVSIVLRTSISRSRLACSASSFSLASCERQLRVKPKPNIPANSQTTADCTTLSNEMRRSAARSTVASANKCNRALVRRSGNCMSMYCDKSLGSFGTVPTSQTW